MNGRRIKGFRFSEGCRVQRWLFHIDFTHPHQFLTIEVERLFEEEIAGQHFPAGKSLALAVTLPNVADAIILVQCLHYEVGALCP
jgi:hypothetical protein